MSWVVDDLYFFDVLGYFFLKIERIYENSDAAILLEDLSLQFLVPMMVCPIQRLNLQRQVSLSEYFCQLRKQRLKHRRGDIEVQVLKEHVRWVNIREVCFYGCSYKLVDHEVRNTHLESKVFVIYKIHLFLGLNVVQELI